jgi:hypothetical protein
MAVYLVLFSYSQIFYCTENKGQRDFKLGLLIHSS